MTTLPELARRLVEESPLSPPPDLADLRRRNTRRSRRRVTMLATAMLAVAALAAISIASIDDTNEGKRQVNAGPRSTSTSSTSPSTASTSPEDPTGPPRLQHQPIGLEVTPSVFDPDGGTSVRFSVRNDSDRDVTWACSLLAGIRLDRWGAGGWRPIGYGFDGPDSLATRRVTLCGGGPTIPPGETVAVEGPLPSPALEPGWYRWVEDSITTKLGEPGPQQPMAEGRFRVEDSGRAPEPQPASHTVWLGGGERLSNLRPTDTGAALVIGGERLALTWTTECNTPGAAVTFNLQADRVEVQLLTGHYVVIDCVGEPAGPWSTVVELPEPLADRPLVVTGPSGERVATSVESRGDGEPDHSGGSPASLGPWLLRSSPSELRLHWHGTTCDRPLNLELIDLGDRVLPRAAVTEEDCPADVWGHAAEATMSIRQDLRHLPIVGVP